MKLKFSKIFFFAFFAIFISIPFFVLGTEYSYDALNRLIEVKYDNGTIVKYTYDAMGNRLTKEVIPSDNSETSTAINENSETSALLTTADSLGGSPEKEISAAEENIDGNKNESEEQTSKTLYKIRKEISNIVENVKSKAKEVKETLQSLEPSEKTDSASSILPKKSADVLSSSLLALSPKFSVLALMLGVIGVLSLFTALLSRTKKKIK